MRGGGSSNHIRGMGSGRPHGRVERWRGRVTCCLRDSAFACLKNARVGRERRNSCVLCAACFLNAVASVRDPRIAL